MSHRRKKDCCGVITKDLYQRIGPGDASDVKYLVKFRGGIVYEGRRLMPNENAYVSGSVIAEILIDDKDMLYFIHENEKQAFLDTYPEFNGYPI